MCQKSGKVNDYDLLLVGLKLKIDHISMTHGQI